MPRVNRITHRGLARSHYGKLNFCPMPGYLPRLKLLKVIERETRDATNDSTISFIDQQGVFIQGFPSVREVSYKRRRL
jgi:hypothetical protein